MSKYAEQKTQFHDAKLLCEALTALGLTVSIFETAQPLVGYRGDDRTDKAEIIVRRKYVGSASNDIGFKRGEDGTYSAIISEYDSHKYNQQWLTKLKVNYVTGEKIQLAKRLGLRFTGAHVDKNGNTKLEFVKV